MINQLNDNMYRSRILQKVKETFENIWKALKLIISFMQTVLRRLIKISTINFLLFFIASIILKSYNNELSFPDTQSLWYTINNA